MVLYLLNLKFNYNSALFLNQALVEKMRFGENY